MELRHSIAELKDGQGRLMTSLALHDQKVDSNVQRIADSQDRLVTAIERIGDATIAIETLTREIKVNGRGHHASLATSPTIPLNRQTVTVGLAILLIAAIAAGGGSELVHTLITALRK